MGLFMNLKLQTDFSEEEMTEETNYFSLQFPSRNWFPPKNAEKQKLKFSRIALFHMKTRGCLICFFHDFRWKAIWIIMFNIGGLLIFGNTRRNTNNGKINRAIIKRAKNSLVSTGCRPVVDFEIS